MQFLDQIIAPCELYADRLALAMYREVTARRSRRCGEGFQIDRALWLAAAANVLSQAGIPCILECFRMTYNFEFLRLRVVARVAWIEFNRVPVNAFNREMV